MQEQQGFDPFEKGSALERAMNLPGSSMDTRDNGFIVHLPLPGTTTMVSGGVCPTAEEAAERTLLARDMVRMCTV